MIKNEEGVLLQVHNIFFKIQVYKIFSLHYKISKVAPYSYWRRLRHFRDLKFEHAGDPRRPSSQAMHLRNGTSVITEASYHRRNGLE